MTRSGEAAERARKGLVESAAIASLLVQRVSKEVLDVLRKSLPSEQVTDGREMWEYLVNTYAVSSASMLEENHFERMALEAIRAADAWDRSSELSTFV